MSIAHIVAVIVCTGLATIGYGIARDPRKKQGSYMSRRRIAIIAVGVILTIVVPAIILTINGTREQPEPAYNNDHFNTHAPTADPPARP